MESPEFNRSMGLDEAEEVIRSWDSAALPQEARDKMIFQGERDEIERYLLAVDEIQRSMSSDGESSRLSSVIHTAMARLEDEYRNLLQTQASSSEADSLAESISSQLSISSDLYGHDQDACDDDGSVHVELVLGLDDSVESTVRSRSSIGSSRSNSSASVRDLDLVPAEVVDDLRIIAERMVACGFASACGRAHGAARRSSLESSLRRLGVESLTVGDAQRIEWAVLERKIRRWIRAARVCVRVLFASEKRLCEQVFSGIGSDASMEDACFGEIVKSPALTLLNVAEAISLANHTAPERLFKILDLRDTLEDLIPEMDIIFEGNSVRSIAAKAAEILLRLGEAVRGILLEFESAVLREPSQVTVPGGTIHPLTRYVMNYISLISDYKQTLGELILLRPLTGSRYSGDTTVPDLELGEFEGKTPLELHLIWIIVILQFNLEGKSRHYSDPSLGQLFVMNNLHYIVQKAKSSPELRKMIGDNYLKRLTGKYRQAATAYQRATWVKVLYCLRDEGLHSSGSFSYSGVLKNVLRERFRAFNAMFDEVHRIQAAWYVPDPQLKEELRISISEHLIPAYRGFLGRYRGHIESGRHPENYIKYSVEDLETALLDFFEGHNHTSHHHSRRRSLS